MCLIEKLSRIIISNHSWYLLRVIKIVRLKSRVKVHNGVNLVLVW